MTNVAEPETRLAVRNRRTTKYCDKCDKRRRLDQYPVNRAAEDGLGSWCLDCCHREGRRIRNAIALRRMRALEEAARVVEPEPDETEIGVAWQKRAACGPGDGDLFYPVSLVDAEGRRQVADAAKVCARCPVRSLCERDAEASNNKWGVWAGRNRQKSHTP